jgi:putative transposase
VVTRQAKRAAVGEMISGYPVSELRACRVMSFPLSTYRYVPMRVDDANLLMRMQRLADEKPRYGMPRIHELLRRSGEQINHKRTERLYYGVLKLGLRRKKPRRRYRCETRSPLAIATGANQIWSMDFVSDQLSDGRRVRGLAVIDVYHRKNLALDFDTSLTGIRVVQNLDRICAVHGFPQFITVDNGPEFICLALDRWAYANGVKLKFSRPGKPTDNPFIESFNGKMRDELLNAHWFTGISDLRTKAAAWQKEYNEYRPHSSLGMLTPTEYAEKGRMQMAEI